MQSLVKGRNQGACGARARNQNAVTGPVPLLLGPYTSCRASGAAALLYDALNLSARS
jgi:hypothetical protein